MRRAASARGGSMLPPGPCMPPIPPMLCPCAPRGAPLSASTVSVAAASGISTSRCSVLGTAPDSPRAVQGVPSAPLVSSCANPTGGSGWRASSLVVGHLVRPSRPIAVLLPTRRGAPSMRRRMPPRVASSSPVDPGAASGAPCVRRRAPPRVASSPPATSTSMPRARAPLLSGCVFEHMPVSCRGGSATQAGAGRASAARSR